MKLAIKQLQKKLERKLKLNKLLKKPREEEIKRRLQRLRLNMIKKNKKLKRPQH